MRFVNYYFDVFLSMQISRTINYISIIGGGLLALYAQSQEEQNNYLIIAGLVLLVFGIYRTARQVPSKFASDEEVTNDDENTD
ncbi:MAG: hypothetical protein AAF901_09045 [Bacteroidota bacterium]